MKKEDTPGPAMYFGAEGVHKHAPALPIRNFNRSQQSASPSPSRDNSPQTSQMLPGAVSDFNWMHR